MSWIQTFTGKQFFPLDARRADIDERDVAHALSLQCRFNGHCRAFYSVAEHSVRVSQILPDPLALWGLMHDAAEAYLTDLPRPLKEQLPWFRQLEERLLGLIAERFELGWPMPEEVAQADDRLLATEARDLMAPAPAPWGLRAEPLAEQIQPWSPRRAERRFLARFARLSGGQEA
ncbi:MAG: phosphohydrolase [Deltaproteobacteria bacterium]|nr:phosphohydrolase [Deltaproteobacteria bacterium]